MELVGSGLGVLLFGYAVAVGGRQGGQGAVGAVGGFAGGTVAGEEVGDWVEDEAVAGAEEGNLVGRERGGRGGSCWGFVSFGGERVVGKEFVI